MKTDLNVATWNVRSLLQVGKLHEIADELIKYNTQITALQEVRWAESGWIRKKNYFFMYSGYKTVKGCSGTGFLITGSAVQSVLGFDPIGDRMCKLRIKGKLYNMTLLSV
jgi:exonuclease III